MSDTPLRVVIAEDNYLVREGTRRLLEDGGGVDVVAAVGTAGELLDAVGRLRPGVVITDIRMPPGHHMEGIAAAHAIRAGHPGTGVVVLSQHADDAYAFELFKNGTAGLAYLLKDRIGDLDELRAALTAVASGGSCIDPVVVEALVSSRTRLAGSALRWLTPRELDVLREMARGRANPGIAAALVLSESAVEKHVSSIFAKLGLGPEPTQDRRVTAVLTFLRDSPGTAGLARSDALARATLSPGDTAGAWQLVGNLCRRTFFPHDTGEAARRHGCRPYRACCKSLPGVLPGRMGFMSRKYLPVNREKPMFLPLDMQSWVPKDHFVWFLVEVAGQLDTSALEAGTSPGRAGRAMTRRCLPRW